MADFNLYICLKDDNIELGYLYVTNKTWRKLTNFSLTPGDGEYVGGLKKEFNSYKINIIHLNKGIIILDITYELWVNESCKNSKSNPLVSTVGIVFEISDFKLTMV